MKLLTRFIYDCAVPLCVGAWAPIPILLYRHISLTLSTWVWLSCVTVFAVIKMVGGYDDFTG